MLASEYNLYKQLSGGHILLLCRTVAIPPNCEQLIYSETAVLLHRFTTELQIPIGKVSSSTPGAAGARALYMELRLRSAAAAASWLAQCRRAAVETAPPAGQAGSSGSSGFEPRAGRWAGLPRREAERRLAADAVAGRARGRSAEMNGVD